MQQGLLTVKFPGENDEDCVLVCTPNSYAEDLIPSRTEFCGRVISKIMKK